MNVVHAVCPKCAHVFTVTKLPRVICSECGKECASRKRDNGELLPWAHYVLGGGECRGCYKKAELASPALPEKP